MFIIITGIITACGDSSSSSSSSAGFILQPGLDKYDLPETSYDVDFIGNETGTYAVMFQQEINDINYIGIALTDDPYGTNFNLKIYFEGSSIPESGEISSDSATITIIKDGTRYTEQSVSLTLNFVKNVFTNSNDVDYSLYTISTSSDPLIEGNTLTINSITALEVE